MKMFINSKQGLNPDVRFSQDVIQNIWRSAQQFDHIIIREHVHVIYCDF